MTGTRTGKRNRKTTHTLEELTAVELEGGRLGGDIRFSSDGRLVVEACSNGEIRIWDAETGHQVGYFPPGNNTEGVLTDVGVEAARKRRERDYSYSVDAPPDGAAEFLFRVISDDGRRVATARSFFSQRDRRNNRCNFSWLIEDPLRGQPPIVISTHDPNYFHDQTIPDPTKCAISPDSRWLLDGGHLFELAGTSRRALVLPSSIDDGMDQFRFSPQPGRVAMLEAPRRYGHSKVVVWDYDSDPDRLFVGGSRNRGGGKGRVAANIPVPGNGYVFGSFSDDGETVLTFATGEPIARTWDTRTGELKRQFDIDEQTKFAALSADASRLCVIDRYGRLTLWNCTSGARILHLGLGLQGLASGNTKFPSPSSAKKAHLAEFSPDGRHLAIGTIDGTVIVIDALSGVTMHVTERTSVEVTKLQFIAGSNTLLFVSTSALNSPQGGPHLTIEGPPRVGLQAIEVESGASLYEFAGSLLAASPDGQRIVLARDKDTLLLSVSSGSTEWSVPAAMTSASFCGERVLMAQDDGDIQDFDLVSGTPMGIYGQLTKNWFGRRLRSEILLQSSADHTVALSGELGNKLPDMKGRRNRAYAEMSFEADIFAGAGRAPLRYRASLFTVSADNGSAVLSVNTGLLLLKEGKIATITLSSSSTLHPSRPTHLAISPDGRFLLVGGHSGDRILIQLENAFNEVRLLGPNHERGPSPSGTFAGFDRSGESLLTYDDGISVWDVAGERRAFNVNFGEAKVTSAGFSADGSQIVALCEDGTARVVGRESGDVDAKLCEQGVAIASVHWGPATGTLAAICSDETLRIFDASNGHLLAAEHVGRVDALTCFSSHGSTAVSLLCGASIHRFRFRKLGQQEKGGPQHFRLDGRSLKSKADVVAFLNIPESVLVRALSGSGDEPRYRSYEIPKRTGGKRRIDAPTGVLQSLQQQISPLLQAVYEAHPSAHGFVKGRSIVTNAAPHTGKRWVLNIDLADFFPSTSFAAVRTLFRAPPFRMGTEAAQTFAELCTYRHGLPQGAPTSPFLSNLAARELDRRLERLAKKFKLVYSRYADDITFSTNAMVFPPSVAATRVSPAGDHVAQAGTELIKAVEAGGFRIKPSKTRLQHSSQRQEVTGLGVNERVNVARERIRRLRAMLHAWGKFGLEAAAWEHFRKYSARGPRMTPRHFVPAYYWQRDSSTGTWEKKFRRERIWPATPDAYTRRLQVSGIKVGGRYLRAQRRTTPPESHASAVGSQPKKYRSFYPGGGTARRIVPASFRRLVIGHLAYLQMVRGADDPIVLKLCVSFARVDPRPPSFVIQIIKNLQTQPSDKAEIAVIERATLSTAVASAARASSAPTKPPTANPPRPNMVVIPAGKLANRKTELHEAMSASAPAEPETIEAFAISKLAVTFEDWDKCIGDSEHPPGQGLDLELPSDRGWGRGTRPVINVSWYDAQLYIAWLNHLDGLTGRPDAYRLPTEAEWEYACLAGATTAYHHGESITTHDANFNGRLIRGATPVGEYRRQTIPVGTFAPNAWGLHEMHGNVWEWCSPGSTVTPRPGNLRALRGGSWSNYAIKLRAGNRWQARADYSAANIGFRLARSLSEA